MAEVVEILADVRARGDAALREWCLRLDGVEPARAIPSGDIPEQALRNLAERVRRWHEAQRPPDVRLEVEPGVELVAAAGGVDEVADRELVADDERRGLVAFE